MNKSAMMACVLMLMGCQAQQPASKPIVEENVSPLDYQACIQAAMSGNGQASAEKCDKVLKDTR